MGKKEHIKDIGKSARRMLDTTTPTKIKYAGATLVFMVFSEAFVNYQAVSQLVDAKVGSLEGILRAGIICLFLTVLIVVFSTIGGDRAKRWFYQHTHGKEPDNTYMTIAVVSIISNLLLISVITYIRFISGDDISTTDATNDTMTQAAGGDAADSADGNAGNHTGETILLLAILLAAGVFSFTYSFVITDPLDHVVNASLRRSETVIRGKLAANAAGRANDFAAATTAIIECEANAVRHKAQDTVTQALLAMASDPAIATRIYRAAADYGLPIPEKTDAATKAVEK